MAYEPHLISPFVDSGLSRYFKPFLIKEEAFPDIEDAYAWQGSVRKREGLRLLASLPAGDKPTQGLKNWINPGTLSESMIAFSTTKSYLLNGVTNVFNDITLLAFGGPGQTNPGSAFSWSNTTSQFFWTSNYAGSMWTTNNLTADHIRFWNGTSGTVGVNGGWSIHRPTVSGTTTLDAALIILPYKGRLVVLNTNEGGSAFSNRARWSQLGTPYTSNSAAVNITAITAANPAVVSIADTTSFTVGQPAGITGVVGSMASVLNNNQFNVISIIPGVSVTINANTTGLTYTSGGTIQGTGTTSPPSPFKIDIFAWRDDIPGRGGFVDADTSERIVSAEIVKDTLIVGFQRSTWRLRYTGNEILPFIWERLNTQYGAESTFSNIAFDDAALFFSRYGWIGSDTNSVVRIDQNIPQDSFSFESIDSSFTGLNFVQGIRDYYRQMAYWTFVTIGNSVPNKIYAYNYIDKSWFIFTPQTGTSGSSTPLGIRCFGYFHTNSDLTWSVLNSSSDKWENYNDSNDVWESFISGQNINFPYIVGGDANGNVYQMFEFFQAPTSDNGTRYSFAISTKRFNPYLKEGLKCRLGYIDIYCTANPGGEITLQHFVDDYDQNPVLTRKVEIFSRGVIGVSSVTPGNPTTIVTLTDHGLVTNEEVTLSNFIGTVASVLNNQTAIATVTNNTTFTIPINTVGLTYLSGGVVYNADLNVGTAKYTKVYLGAIAHMHQIVLTLTPDQVLDPVKGAAQFELQGIVAWTRKMGKIRG